MNTVAVLDSDLSPYLARGTRSSATTTLAMINAVMPRIYAKGHYIPLVHEVEIDVTSGYGFLDPDDATLISASLKEIPITINDISYQTRRPGVGRLVRPIAYEYGIIDRGLFPVKSEMPTAGATEFVFTSATNATFVAGDIVTVTYTDTEEGYAQVALPLQRLTIAASGATAITVAADGGTDATTGELITRLTVSASASQVLLVAGLGLTLSQLTGTDATYIGTFRIHSVPDSTHVYIVKSYVALTGTLAAVSTPRLMPVSTIASVQSIKFASLPSRVTVADDDGIIYADLIPGSGVSSYRRYDVLQVPENATEEDEWILRGVAKRKFIKLTSTDDIVYMDSVDALTEAFLATVARENSDMDKYRFHWKNCFDILSSQLYDEKGGVTQYPTQELWGAGIPGLDSRY